ncbi:Uncharacterised protein [Vibrio cholerae]|nr:Uncharacterised protein [Vibrio cholerae]
MVHSLKLSLVVATLLFSRVLTNYSVVCACVRTNSSS